MFSITKDLRRPLIELWQTDNRTEFLVRFFHFQFPQTTTTTTTTFSRYWIDRYRRWIQVGGTKGVLCRVKLEFCLFVIYKLVAGFHQHMRKWRYFRQLCRGCTIMFLYLGQISLWEYIDVTCEWMEDKSKLGEGWREATKSYNKKRGRDRKWKRNAIKSVWFDSSLKDLSELDLILQIFLCVPILYLCFIIDAVPWQLCQEICEYIPKEAELLTSKIR